MVDSRWNHTQVGHSIPVRFIFDRPFNQNNKIAPIFRKIFMDLFAFEYLGNMRLATKLGLFLCGSRVHLAAKCQTGVVDWQPSPRKCRSDASTNRRVQTKDFLTSSWISDCRFDKMGKHEYLSEHELIRIFSACRNLSITRCSIIYGGERDKVDV